MSGKRLAIIGGGFAGMWAALSAARENHINNGQFEITLISKDPYIVMRPRLYEANPAAMREPLFSLVAKIGVNTVEGEVVKIVTARNQVVTRLATGVEKTLGYDSLVLASGSELALDIIAGSQQHAFNVDSYHAACLLEEHIKSQIALHEHNDQAGSLGFVIVGAGFTGVELATGLRARLSDLTNPDVANAARIVLIEADSQLAPTLGSGPRPAIARALEVAKVEVKLGTTISAIQVDGVSINTGEFIPANTTIVTIGPRANPLTAQVGAQRDATGRLVVDQYLSVAGEDDIFAAGDVAQGMTDGKHISVMSCQHAMPQGKYAGYNAARQLLNLPAKAYTQPYYQTCLDLGAGGAVLTTGWEREIKAEGPEAKALKQQINELWIKPPQGTVDQILNAAQLDYRVGKSSDDQ